MTKNAYYQEIGILRNKYQKGINDLYIWSSLAIDSLELALKDHDFLTIREFSVPSKKAEKKVKRTKEQKSK